MRPADQVAVTFEQHWDERGLADKTQTLTATQTLMPPKSLLERDRRSALPRILSTTKNSSQLEVVGEIGRGGMGIVRLARQLALRREVAIKQVREDRRTARHAQELVQEGLLVGALEHPNIVPVYMLGEDDDGYPTIVMKRIEGESWLDRIRAGGDPIEWHIDVLMQVCRAIGFAHSRDVLHRDLKPENVMVGTFGEVYLLDWGIAVSTDDAADNPFPRAADATDVAGTPAYMSPEQVRGAAESLSPRTDVYLLGAVLHEVLTGEPPHTGDTLFEVMHHAYESEPIVYDDVPKELARICNRAMAFAPQDRFESAEALRVALATYLYHRESMALADEGRVRLAELREAIAAGDADGVDRAYAAARFAFDAALATWAENHDAASGRVEAIEAMAWWEVGAKSARAATKLLGELTAPPQALRAAVEELAAAAATRDARAEQLTQLEDEADLSQHAQWRAAVLYAIAFDWLLALVVYEVWGPLPHTMLAVAGLSTLAFGAFVAWLGRRRFSANLVNRQLLGAYAMCIAGMVLSHVAVEVAGFEPIVGSLVDCAIFAGVSGAIALMLDRRFVFVAATHIVGIAWIALAPHHGFMPLAVTSFCSEFLGGTFALFDWRRGRSPAGWFR